MQLNKNIKIFINYFFGPLLFLWLSYSIYRDILHQPGLQESLLHIKLSIRSYKVSSLFFAFVLIFINWGLEAWKWKHTIKTIYPISFLSAFRATLSGVAFSVTMPNRVGEYFGRIMYLPEGKRLKTISVTLVCSFAQLIITILAGTAGFLIMKSTLLQHLSVNLIGYRFAIYGLVCLNLVFLIIYFNVGGTVHLFHNRIRNKKYLYLIEALRNFNVRLLIELLFISFLRYIVFLVQYLLIFYLFDVNIPVGITGSIMSIVFLSMAIIPSIALVEAGVRGKIMISLMGWFTMNTLGVGLTSVTVWFINLILPAVAGSLLLLNLKVFKKRNEVV